MTERLPFQTTVLRNSVQLAMHRRCAEIMRLVDPELICPGHGELLRCSKEEIDVYCDFIDRKERVFRELVDAPADHFIDLFWARLLPYVADVAAGQTVSYTLKLRNNLQRPAVYGARLLVPDGWATPDATEALTLDENARGEIVLHAVAPATGDHARRLVTAEIWIDDVSQGPVCEALVTVVGERDGR
jgi:hypothetical protein